MKNIYEKASAAAYYLRNQIKDLSLSGAIVTGTGLGELWNDMEILHKIAYASIPHFPINTVISHAGDLFIVKSQEKYLAIFSGRFHLYEGYKAEETSFPVRVMKLLNIDQLLITNVAGGLNSNYSVGTIVGITDHINLQNTNTLIGINDERFGTRFPDMIDCYNRAVLIAWQNFSKSKRIDFQMGIYLGLQGPSLETLAEYAFVQKAGADLVGMSTVQEVIVAKHMNMKVNAISVVSNICHTHEEISKTTIEEVISVAKRSIPQLNLLIQCWINQLH